MTRRHTKAAATGHVDGACAQQFTTPPEQTLGPYNPDRMPLDQDNDLLIINDAVTSAIGEISWISGRILSNTGARRAGGDLASRYQRRLHPQRCYHRDVRSFIVLLLLASASFASDARLRSRERGAGKSKERAIYIAKDAAHVFPYVVDGGGWSTEFTFMNLENRNVKLFCDYVAPDGAAWELSTEIGRSAGVEVDFARYGVVTLRTNGGGSTMQTGWVFCGADNVEDRIAAHATIRGESGGVLREFAMPLLPDFQSRFLVPFVRPATSRNELLLVNTATETPTTMTLKLQTPTEITATVNLAPGEQKIINLSEQFNLATNFTAASILVEVQSGSRFVTGMVLRTGDAGGVAFLPFAEFVE